MAGAGGSAIHPVLIALGPVTLYAYGFMVAVAFALGTWASAVRAPRCGLVPEVVYDSAVPVLLAALVGAKVMYLLTVGPGPVRSAADLLGLLRGGFVYYGGVLGGALGALWWLNRRGVPALAYADAIAPGMGFAQALGRIGCFLNGCCYGKPFAAGLVVPSLGDGLPRHPVPLYEAATALALGGLLWIIPPHPARPGRSFGIFLVVHAVVRYGMEILRDDPRGDLLFGTLTPSQGLGLVGLAIGLWLVARRPAR